MKNVFFMAVLGLPVIAGCSTGHLEKQKTTAIATEALTFKDVTASSGITSKPTWKYGGPSIADLNGDGRYELMLSNHHREPAQLFWANGDAFTYTEHTRPIMKHDVHGIAPGDYDQDGDADLLISLGGGNGTKPQPPRLLRNDNGKFVDVTDQVGIAGMGARGRAVRWVDLDLDGDLDLIQINAAVLVDENIPRNLMFENLGNGTFKYVQNTEFENIDAERVLLTDINGDDIADLICFTPLSVWQGTGGFNFVDVSNTVLPKSALALDHVMTAADIDIDNDGDLDLYLARGKTYYELANNSLEFDPVSTRLDIRDEGNKSHDGVSFTADGDLVLSNFFRWYRGKEFEPKVYLGSAKTPIDSPLKGTELQDAKMTITPDMAAGFPEDLDQSGWYLGYLGGGQWRFEWLLKDHLAWGLRTSISGVSSVQPDWPPSNTDLTDRLLINQGGTFIEPDFALPAEHKGNNWGVTHADFDNDGWQDLFVYRFGKLRQRLPDMLLRNQQGKGFVADFGHGATNAGIDSHGDMGATFDYNQDGKVDILSGDDNPGRWHLFENTTPLKNNYLQVQVGYSPQGVDPIGAQVWVNTEKNTVYRTVGSAGATHSQSLLNTVHVGLGSNAQAQSVTVRWRNGEEKTVSSVNANQRIQFP